MRTVRQSLKGETMVKVKGAAVKRVLDPLLSTLQQVSTFDPSSMRDSSNFFRFVTDWHMSSSLLRQHIKSYYMHNVFELVKIDIIPNRDASGNLIMDSNGDISMIEGITNAGSLFDVWHNIDIETVKESCRIYSVHSEDVDRQNLRWSWELLLANVDSDLRHHIISEVEPMDEDIGQTGPIAFYIAATKIIKSTSTLAHNVISGLMILELRHFEGEDVNECVFVLRNVLKFLNHGHPTFDKTPPTIMDNLYDVFLNATNVQFRFYVQNVKDFHSGTVGTPEKLFAKLQHYYSDLKTKPGKVWLPIKKAKSIFPAETLPPSPLVAQPAQPTERDRKGNVIDRRPPGQNEPNSRVSDITGRTEYWCQKCRKGGRWGNHDSAGHDKWQADFNETMKRKKAERNNVSELVQQPTQQTSQQPATVAPSSMRTNMGMASVGSIMRCPYVSFFDSDEESF